MVDQKRILIFGVTGVDKRAALGRLAAWAESHRTRKARVVDFEGDYLFNPARGGKSWFSFLDDEQPSQRALWHSAWQRFASEVLGSNVQKDLYLAIHGCIVRGHYGVRCVADPDEIARTYRPDLVVTLIDDVYDMWWRTEARAEDEPYRGRPTLEQLAFARRCELIIADQVAYSSAAPIPHFLISVAHPCETLANRIYGRGPTVIYLCFPISAPREMKEQNDPSGETEVMDFLRQAYERQRSNPDLAFVCPLGIDELPLVRTAGAALRALSPEADVESQAPIMFERESLRWALGSLWPPDTCLSPGPPSPKDRKRMPVSQLLGASGMLETDVGWRDYRLVAQAKEGCLAAFNPIFKGRKRFSRSVLREIRFAAGICPVYVYQNPEYDPDDLFDREFPQGGTMQPEPRELMVIRKNSVADLYDAIEKYATRRS